jgi:hypothetical protein
MRVAIGVPAGRVGAGSEAVGGGHEQVLSTGVLERFGQPGLVAEAIDDEDIALADLDGVLRGGLELVGVKAGGQKAIDLEAVTGNVPGNVGQKGLGGEDVEGAGLGGIAC